MKRSIFCTMAAAATLALSACAEAEQSSAPAFRPIETYSEQPLTSSETATTSSKEEDREPELVTVTSTIKQTQVAEKPASSDPAAGGNHYYTASNGVLPATPSCDGRWILIDESIHGQGSNTPSEITRALKSYLGSGYLQPGACPSLRAQVDGQDIYAVYRDFGTDLKAACDAWDAGGQASNPRSLNTSGDMSHPC